MKKIPSGYAFAVAIIIFSTLFPAKADVWHEFNFLDNNAISFLNALKQESKGQTSVFVDTPVRGWIKESDIPALIALLDSTESCMSVVQVKSSHLPGLSTVGDEAALLIDGFRNGFYPSELNSKKYSAAEKERLRSWWQRYLSAKPLK